MANQYFTCVLDGWRDGTTLYGRMHYYRTDGLTYTYQDTSFPNPTMDLAGTSYADTVLGDAVRGGTQLGSLYGGTYSRTVSGTGARTITYSAGSGLRSDFAGSWSTSVGGFPGTSSPPTSISCSNVQRGQDYFTATVSLGSWGTNNTGSGSRYRELQVWTAGMVEPRRYQPQYGDSLSGTITCNNSSSGSLTITPNTMYRIGVYASNGAQNTGSVSVGDYTTLPPTPTISNIDVTSTTATFTYSCPNQGGKYDMTLKYQLDGGSAVTVTTLSGSGTKAGTFTISGLSGGTTHTVTAALSTSAGEVVSNTITFTTATPNPKLYGPARAVSDIGSLQIETSAYPSVSAVNKATFISKINSIKSIRNKIIANDDITSAALEILKNSDDTWNGSVAVNFGGTTIKSGTSSTSLSDAIAYIESCGGTVITPVTRSLYSPLTLTNITYGNGTKQISKLYGSVNGQTKEIKKLYGSVNGQTKLVYQS